MGGEPGVAIPGIAGGFPWPDRGAVGQRHIGKGDRLHRHGPARGGRQGRREQRALERLDPDPVGGSALGEQDDVTARPQPCRQFIALLSAKAPVSADEDRAGQPGQPAENRPARHLRLRHEGPVHRIAQHQDVQPGHMVGDEQRRTGRPRRAMQAHLDVQQPQTGLAPDELDDPRPAPAKRPRHEMGRHAQQEQHPKAGRPEGEADRRQTTPPRLRGGHRFQGPPPPHAAARAVGPVVFWNRRRLRWRTCAQGSSTQTSMVLNSRSKDAPSPTVAPARR